MQAWLPHAKCGDVPALLEPSYLPVLLPPSRGDTMRPRTEIIAVTIAVAGLLMGAVRANAQPNAITDRYLTTVQADLNGSLDTRKAAVGQQVTVTTRQDTRLANGTELPKGTKLVGHITQVQAQDTEHVGAMLAVLFDHAELKGGQVVQVRSVIQGVAPVKPMAAPDMAGPGYGSMGGGGGMSGTQRGGMGSGTGGGGLGDGGTGMGRAGTTSMGGGGVLGGSPQPAGRSNDPSLSGAGGVGGSGGGMGGTGGGMGNAGGIGNAGGTDSSDPNSSPSLQNTNIGHLPAGAVSNSRPVVAAGESVSTAPRTTALPGVLLSTTATANASGTLIAPGRNISLTSGTVITLGVITR